MPTQQFVHKQIPVFAHQWHKNGDHPDDHCRLIPSPNGPFLSEGQLVRYFRHPGIDGDSWCHSCCRTMNEHGFIDQVPRQHVVCPGDFIITDNYGGVVDVVKPDAFPYLYEPHKTEKNETE